MKQTLILARLLATLVPALLVAAGSAGVAQAETAGESRVQEIAGGTAAGPAVTNVLPEEVPDQRQNATTVEPAVSEAAPEAAAKPAPPLPPTLTIDINLTSQRMTVSENGVAKYTWSVSSGAYGYATPTGTFKPVWMAKMWHSRQYDMTPMPHSIFFHGGVAIHATYSVSLLGRPASRGCVRLAPKNAATLFGIVTRHGKERTRIVVHGKPNYAQPKIASRKPAAPAVRGPGNSVRYSAYGYSPTAPAAPRYIYPGDQRYYYVQSANRRAAAMKQRRKAMRPYYSGYGGGY